MKNHVYAFNNEIRKQTKGGPIGLKLTVVLAQIFMIWWDQEFASRLKEVGIVQTMNKRYVDDINIAVQATVPGLRYRDGQLTMVGHDIHPSIKLEVDYPTKQTDKKLPILGLKVWVEQIEKGIEGTSQIVSMIMYEFYAEEVVSKAVINARSAMSASMNRTVLSQEVLRVLLNYSPELPWTNVREKVEAVVLRMYYTE